MIISLFLAFVIFVLFAVMAYVDDSREKLIIGVINFILSFLLILNITHV